MLRLQAEQAAQAQGEELSAEPFDSNCITPGTAFMQRLGAHLRFFIRKKLASDAVWQKPEVVFSGEGHASQCGAGAASRAAQQYPGSRGRPLPFQGWHGCAGPDFQEAPA